MDGGRGALGPTVGRSALPEPSGERHPLIELMLQRMAHGSRRGARTDGATIALAIEGGGSRGVVSGGMCLALEKAGLIDAVDVIYGTSSGALNGSFTAAGQAAFGATNYIDIAMLRFANPLRLLTGHAVIDFDVLFDEMIRGRKPYDEEGLRTGPVFRALAVDLESSAATVLGDFPDTEELLEAVQVSCSIPLLTGAPAIFRGRPMADGGLIESIPFGPALSDATGVLVLRSRPAGFRRDRYPRAVIDLATRSAHPALGPLMRASPDRYNALAEHLQRAGESDPRLFQIAPAPGTQRVGQLEVSAGVIREGLGGGSEGRGERVRAASGGRAVAARAL